MPTTLPVRRIALDMDDDLLGFMRTLLRLYLVVAMALSVCTAVERHFGMFKGLSVAESILKATATNFTAFSE
jgi:hypothetical protein